MSLPKGLYEKSDFLGAVQCLGVLGLASMTGAASYFALDHGMLAAPFLAAHGTVCSSFMSAVHELNHETVFKTPVLNRAFVKVFDFFNWTDSKALWNRHIHHHQIALHDNDPEVDGNCRRLWIGTLVWSLSFNLPRFFASISKPHPAMILLILLILCQQWKLVLLVSLAPFLFNLLSVFCMVTQHVGMAKNSPDPNREARSMKLPFLFSFINWRMEHHLEHHLYPRVPCYRLSQVRNHVTLPKALTVREAIREILRPKKITECGSGEHPLKRLKKIKTLLDTP